MCNFNQKRQVVHSFSCKLESLLTTAFLLVDECKSIVAHTFDQGCWYTSCELRIGGVDDWNLEGRFIRRWDLAPEGLKFILGQLIVLVDQTMKIALYLEVEYIMRSFHCGLYKERILRRIFSIQILLVNFADNGTFVYSTWCWELESIWRRHKQAPGILVEH